MWRDRALRLQAEMDNYKYDVERVRARGEPFDPNWHQAVGVVSAGDLGVEDGTVIEVMEAGYRRGDRLLRPARVVVAQ
jgi:molecular chaperone GrpE